MAAGTSKSTALQEEASDPENFNDTLQAALSRLGGIRTFKGSSLRAAESEAKAGLASGSLGSLGSTKASNLISKMKKKETTASKKKRKAGAALSSTQAKLFKVQAVVIYTSAEIRKEEPHGELVLANTKAVSSVGTVRSLAKTGRAVMDVELDASWSADRVATELEKLFPAFFHYLSGLKPRQDRLPHWALCYRDGRRLKVWPDAKPTGGDLFQVKSTRPSRPIAECYIHIVARETIPQEVVEVWHLMPYDIGHQIGSDDSDEELGEVSDEESLARRALTKAKGKKRARPLIESEESDASDQSLPSRISHLTSPMHGFSAAPKEPSLVEQGNILSETPPEVNEVNQPQDQQPTATEAISFIEIEDTPSPSVLPIASTPSPALEETADTTEAGTPPLKPISDSKTQWSPSTFEAGPSVRNVWQQGLEEFDF